MTGIETRRAVYAVKEHQIQKHLAKFDKYILVNYFVPVLVIE